MDSSPQRPPGVRVGSFTLNVSSRELCSGAVRIRLAEQPFEILRMLLERPGQVVTRDELRHRLWPDGTHVDFEHSLNTAVKRLRVALGDEADCPTFVETIPRRGYRLIAAVPQASAVAAALPTPKSGVHHAFGNVPRLAVLPFSNISGDPEQQYFSEGLTEEMIAQLGRRYGTRLGVIARWSSMAARDGRRGAREIGQALRADYLLEGSVRREGERVRITARLVAADDETHLWAESYERELNDYLSVQAEVAARIARSLATELFDVATLAERPATSDAYQAFLKGRYHWNRPGDDGIDEALRYFNQAIRLDPAFAAAHASRARVLVAQAEYYAGVPRDLLELARASATAALRLDPAHWRAHVALGDTLRLLDWNWTDAEAAYLEACALNPSSESAHRSYGLMLSLTGRHDEARRLSERAVELDPLCMVVGVTAAWVRYLAGDYQGAAERCRHYMEMDPQYGFSAASRVLAAAHLQSGRPSEAVRELESALRVSPDEPVVLAWLAHARGVTGDRAGARVLIDRLNRDGRRTTPSYHLALALVGIGEHDAALNALDRALVSRDPLVAYVAVEPRFAALRADPRCAALLQRLGLAVLSF